MAMVMSAVATTAAATTTAIAAAAAMAPSIGLGLETNQGDGHDRQTQHQLKNIALHLITSETRGQKWNEQIRFHKCASGRAVVARGASKNQQARVSNCYRAENVFLN